MTERKMSAKLLTILALSALASLSTASASEIEGRWTGAIVFHAAANASNDDNSEFGDFVYNGSWRSVAWAP